MDGIGRGTILGGRYEIDRALSRRDGVEQWIARDATLGREVTVTCFAADHPFASAALDSARRVAGVEDRRLSQVLDVGTETDPPVSYVVSEATHHSQSVAALLRLDTLPAEEVRRLVGESALALETARQRGLHHQILNPHHVLRSPDGAVQVAGVAVGAALTGHDGDDGDTASRDDVRALVSVAYAGLTGRWPGPDEVPGLETVSRRADGQLPSPSELVSNVPGDLDTLARTVLGDDEGPRTPGELARQLSPWSSDQVHGIGGRTPEQGGVTGVEQRGGRTTGATGRHLAGGAAAAGAGAAGAGVAGAAGATAAGATRADDDLTDPRGLGTDPDATVVGRRPEFDNDETSTFQAAPASAYDPYVEEDLDPPLPLLTSGTAEPDRSSSRLALAIVAVTVVVAMLLGFLGLRSLFGSPDSTSADDPAAPGTSATSTASGTGGSTSSSASPSSGQKLTVSDITSLDPQGDGDEHNDLVDKAIDGDPETVWMTHRYLRETFTRSGKQAAGVVLDLGEPRDVGTVKVLVDGGAIDATVYVSDEKQIEGAQQLGQLSGTGQQEVRSSDAKKGRYVIVWVTKLGPQDTGGFRAQIGEIEVLS